MKKINCSQSSLKLKTMEGSFSAGTDWRKLSQKEKTEASPDKSQTRREKGTPGRERSSGMQEKIKNFSFHIIIAYIVNSIGARPVTYRIESSQLCELKTVVALILKMKNWHQKR